MRYDVAGLPNSLNPVKNTSENVKSISENIYCFSNIYMIDMRKEKNIDIQRFKFTYFMITTSKKY